MILSLLPPDAKRRAFRAITQLISRHGSRHVFACVRQPCDRQSRGRAAHARAKAKPAKDTMLDGKSTLS
jgi:hypothetical protein